MQLWSLLSARFAGLARLSGFGLVLLLAAGLAHSGAQPPAAHAQSAPYTYFPSASITDGRMLSLAGAGLNTLGNTKMNIALSVPAGQPSFEVGIFDGDTGKGSLGNVTGAGHWDQGMDQLVFSLYADPLEDQCGGTLIARWTGNDPNPLSGAYWSAPAAAMLDNAWWSATVRTSPEARAPNGNYFYNLQISLSNPAGSTCSDFKLRATANLEVRCATFGFEASLRQTVRDGQILYPSWNGSLTGQPNNYFLTTPTTYDGTWTFYLEAPTSTSAVTVWDGDFDFGTPPGAVGSPSGVALEPVQDTDDPDTANVIPSWAAGTAAGAEGAQGTGSPSDETTYDFYRRSPAVRYQVVDPNGKTYRNDNPSGNSEWEQFRITNNPADTRATADYAPNVAADGGTYPTTDTLPAGVWKVQLSGLDLANLDFLKTDQTILGVCADGTPCPTRVPLRPLTLGSAVWADVNGNGQPDAGEAGIPGVLVCLYDGNGTEVAYTTTDASGLYAFQVYPGTYTVAIDAQNLVTGGKLAGQRCTTGAAYCRTAVTTASALGLNFGYQAPVAANGSLGDRVWQDLNGNGAQDSGEPGLAGVQLQLQNGSGTVVATTTTDSTGAYRFGSLAAGSYTVAVVPASLPGGAVPTFDLDGVSSAHTAAVTLAAGQNRTDVDFGYATAKPAGLGSLGSKVWLDTNASGTQDSGEPGLAGVKLTLAWDTNKDGIVDFTSTATTDANGAYRFSSLPAGAYTVTVDTTTLPGGVLPVYDLDGVNSANTASATLNSGQNLTTANFGYQGTGAIGDTVWSDTNGNGVPDSGEPGLGGVTVSLSGAGLAQSTTTNASGAYAFGRLPAGSYTVTVSNLPAGVKPTYDLDGTSTAHTATVALAAGQGRTDVDFGYLPANATVTGLLFRDDNQNHTLDSGEPGLGGQAVALTDASGAVAGTTSTDASGAFSFPSLQAGTYTVSVPGTAAGYAATQSSATLTVAPAGTALASFPYLGGTLSGSLYNDANKNSAKDNGEAGVSGVLVTLKDSSGNVVATTTTSSTGAYSFGNLAAGSYTVSAPATAGSYTLETASSLPVTLAAGGSAANSNFGYVPAAATTGGIAGRLWVDDNGNGSQDSGEVGLAGVTVLLRMPSGATPTVTTDASGNYSFGSLAAGSYRVEVPNTTNGVLLSLTNQDVSVTVTAGQTAAVNVPYHGATLSGYVYTDGNRNQTKDSGEVALVGVTVTLKNGSGAIVQTQVTDANGAYSFVGDLQSGSYSIAGPSVINGLVPTSANPLGVNVAAGQTWANANLGYGPTASNNSGVYTTYLQTEWNNNAGYTLISNNFSKVFPGNTVSVGRGYTLTWNTADAVHAFLPQGGQPGVLTASAVNPVKSNANVFASELLSLRMNVAFSDAGATRSGLGAQAVQKGGVLVGYTVYQVLDLCDRVVGGDLTALPSGVTVTNLSDLCHNLNANYDNGAVDNGYLK